MPRAVSPELRTLTLVGGASRLWLRSTGNNHQLWCLDADNGETLQHWSDLDGTIVTSPNGGLYLMHGNSLGLVRLNDSCASQTS